MRLRERINRFLFNVSVKSIERTPTVRRGDNDFTVLSMVQKRDVLPYLLAVKSFARHTRPERIVVVADPTLDESCRRIMKRHVEPIEFREAAEFRRDGVPVGGTWERLLAISHYVSDGYVIQLDADTATIATPQHVLEAVRDQTGFTLGTEDDQQIVSTDAISAWASARLDDDSHVQLIAESKLALLPDKERWRYARGCSGFAGFPKNSLRPEVLEEFSRGMSALIPDLWAKWGTEQFASNVMVASQPRSRLLPHPTYCAPHYRTDATVFMHFIGYVRYATTLYAAVARQISDELRGSV